MDEGLRPDVFSHEGDGGLPGYLSRQGCMLVVDRELIHEGSAGPFDLVADYGRALEGLRVETATDYWPAGVRFHELENEQVRKATDNLTLLAAVGMSGAGVTLDDLSFKLLYAANFTLGYIPGLEAAVENLGSSWALVAPLRGGKIVQEIVRARGYNPVMPQVRESRVILKSGEYLVGLRSDDGKLLQGVNTLVFGDDCRAAAGSEDTTLRWSLGINPAIDQIRSVVGVGVKSSSELLMTTWTNQGRGYEQHVGGAANAMNKAYYLQVIISEIAQGRFPEGCNFRVGDMGLAMSFESPRVREVLIPVVRAVAQGRVKPELVFEVTQRAVAFPERLHIQAMKLMAATWRL